MSSSLGDGSEGHGRTARGPSSLETSPTWCRLYDSGFRVRGVRFRVHVSGSRVQALNPKRLGFFSLGCKPQGPGDWGLLLEVGAFGFRVDRDGLPRRGQVREEALVQLLIFRRFPD